MTTYRLADPLPDTVAAELGKYDSLTQKLLYRRGITTKAAAIDFITPSYDDHLHDPLLLHDIEKAAERILKAIAAGERIAIYSDYDCDGIPGGVVLHDFFRAIKYEAFLNYIPHRHFEGFGFNVDAVDTLKAKDVSLIITIDCGTTDVAATTKAKEMGIDVIVTDHHEPGDVLPEALAIVNPKLGDYPFQGLCGAAVVYKLVQVLISKGDFKLIPGYEKWWLDMVGIATIADMVPLVGENRVLAKYGLDVLRKSRRPGLQQLLRKQGASQRHLTEDDIGFTIGPRINAASRMDTPDTAFNLLATKDEGEAGAYVATLEKLNNERKGLVSSMTKEIHKRMKEMVDIPAVLVMGNPDWRPALVGLAANKLAEEYKRPAFLWGRDGKGVIKGSCRSEGSVSVVNLMRAMSDDLLEHGGHHMSGGFAVSEEKIHTFGKSLNEAFESIGEAAYIDEPYIADASLTLEDINQTTLKALATLAPYGMDNPKPLFEFKDIVPQSVDMFGKTKEHLKLIFSTDRDDREAIAFFATPDQYHRKPEPGEKITLLGHIEQSFFMGRLQTRLRIVEIV